MNGYYALDRTQINFSQRLPKSIIRALSSALYIKSGQKKGNLPLYETYLSSEDIQIIKYQNSKTVPGSRSKFQIHHDRAVRLFLRDPQAMLRYPVFWDQYLRATKTKGVGGRRTRIPKRRPIRRTRVLRPLL